MSATVPQLCIATGAYGLQYDVEDVPNWRGIELAAIGALEGG